MENYLIHFNNLLKEQKYFKAHEALEPLWLYCKKEGDCLTPLIKGYINAAIAFEHIKRGRQNGDIKAKKTFACYLKYHHLTPTESHIFLVTTKNIDSIATRMDIL